MIYPGMFEDPIFGPMTELESISKRREAGLSDWVEDPSHSKRIFKEESPNVSGLRYIQNWITEDVSKELISYIDQLPWEDTLQRRTQQYGYKYDYLNSNRRGLKIYDKSYLGILPDFLNPICQRLVNGGIFSEIPNQIIINEYQPGQGIAPHIDCKPCFGDTIASLSLGSTCTMVFQDMAARSMPLVLYPNSLLVLKDKARYECFHGIRAQMFDVIDNEKVKRQRRVSITFRNVI